MRPLNRPNFNELAAKHPKIAAWLKEHRDSFREATGVFADDAALILALVKLNRSFGRPRFWKDEIDRHRCEVLGDFLDGREVDSAELKTAIVMILQSYGEAMDSLHAAMQRQTRPKPPSPRPWRPLHPGLRGPH